MPDVLIQGDGVLQHAVCLDSVERMVAGGANSCLHMGMLKML